MLTGYKQVDDINKVVPGTHVRNFTKEKGTNERKFRMGGFLSKIDEGAKYIVLYNGTYLSKENSEKALNYLSKSEFSKGIRAAVPNEVLVAHKYGTRDEFDSKGNSTNIQLHHFGIVYHKQKPFLIGIMTRGGKKEIREKIIYDLSKLTYDEVESFCNKNGLDN